MEFAAMNDIREDFEDSVRDLDRIGWLLKHPCSGTTKTGRKCKRRAAILFKGRWYCWTHNPLPATER